MPLLDENALEVVRAALDQPDDDATIKYLLDHADELPIEVKNRLAISIIGKSLQDGARAMNETSDFIEMLVQAQKAAETKK